MESVIEIRDLGIAFGSDANRTEVLKSLDLDVARGEFVAIVGASGVGKSTLLRILMGLAKPSQGNVRIETDSSFSRAMALVFQDSRLLPWRKILSNVCFGLEKIPLSRAQRRERAMKALARVGLRETAARWPHQLSGGQKQRVAFARALAVEPAILLMDEPFSALDVATREALQNDLVRIHRETGKTVLFVTHDIDEAVYLADRIVALGGKPGEVKADLPVAVERPRRRTDPALLALAADIKRTIAEQAPSRDDWVI
jgi:NitT/TauT family transport system ATP-binding protein